MKIAVIGIGKMGSWIAKELAKENEVAVYDLDLEKAETVQNAKVISNLSELEQFKPEMLINAVSLQHTIAAFELIAKNIGKDCLIADIASIKGELPEYYKKCGFKFASLHPMFGPTFADMGSLKEFNAIIIKESDENTKKFFRKFFEKHGLEISECSFKEHDEMMAYSLTTPFVSSLVFAACVNKTTVPGSTFAKHMKIAKGVLSEDDSLIAEVLFNPNSMKQLDTITARLEYLKHIIKANDNEEITDFLNKLRKNLELNR